MPLKLSRAPIQPCQVSDRASSAARSRAAAIWRCSRIHRIWKPASTPALITVALISAQIRTSRERDLRPRADLLTDELSPTGPTSGTPPDPWLTCMPASCGSASCGPRPDGSAYGTGPRPQAWP